MERMQAMGEIGEQRHQPYPDYKASGIEWVGEIPAHWDVLQLRHLTQCLDGQRVPLNAEQRGEMQGEYPYWGANGVLDHVNDYLFDEPLVLLGEDGAPFFSTNKTVAFFVNEKIWVNNHAHILRTKSRISPKFQVHCLNVVEYRKFIDGSTRDKLTQNDMKAIPIQLPPLEEQESIANFLDRETARIDELIAKKQRLIDLLQEKRTALISQAVTKGLNPHAPMKDSGIEWLGNIPAHWEIIPLKFQFQNLDHRRIPVAAEERISIEKIYPYYGASGIIDFVDDFIFDETLILVAEDGANLLSRSTPLAFLAVGKYWVNNHAHILRPVKGDIRFWNFLLQSYDYTPLITGAAQPKLTSERLSSIPLPSPPESEQKMVADILDQKTEGIDELINKVRDAIEKLNEYRSSIISAAVTGKIDVRQMATEESISA